ncbi:MAG: hypothetical protein SCALA702_24230 [Melioribacteraceae bacterium]|nr:MAG: hypothetical protein SCALA702_24230 [Melioribacteraceae bacterium]
MNRVQKQVLLVTIAIIAVSFLLWIAYGGEIFTKYKMLVETQSELDKQLGITNKEWVDTFIWGLDYTLIITGITVVAGGIMMFLKRDKQTS